MEHRVVAHEEWVAARRKHLADEKEFSKARDRLSEARRELPWELVDTDYRFEGDGGSRSLLDLFDGRGQLVIYHAMFNPETASDKTSWTKDAACFVCTFWMDNVSNVVVHLNHHDVTMAAVSLAPYATFEAYRRRMGWAFPVYSSAGSDFNFDYHVSFTPDQLKSGQAEYNYRVDPVRGSEAPGASVFLRDGDKVFHTYSTYARGLDLLNAAYNYMDIMPRGRDEGPAGLMAWLRRRDEYPG